MYACAGACGCAFLCARNFCVCVCVYVFVFVYVCLCIL